MCNLSGRDSLIGHGLFIHIERVRKSFDGLLQDYNSTKLLLRLDLINCIKRVAYNMNHLKITNILNIFTGVRKVRI